MSFETGPGIPESGLPVWHDELRSTHGVRPDGGINLSKAPFVPVLLCAVQHQDELLLVKRNPALRNAGGKWSFISGYIDKPESVAWHAQQELHSEAGIVVPRSDINIRNSYILKNSQQPRNHMVWMCHVLLQTRPELTLDSTELVDAAWVHPDALPSYDILDDLPYAKDVALGNVQPGSPPLT